MAIVIPFRGKFMRPNTPFDPFEFTLKMSGDGDEADMSVTLEVISSRRPETIPRLVQTLRELARRIELGNF